MLREEVVPGCVIHLGRWWSTPWGPEWDTVIVGNAWRLGVGSHPQALPHRSDVEVPRGMTFCSRYAARTLRPKGRRRFDVLCTCLPPRTSRSWNEALWNAFWMALDIPLAAVCPCGSGTTFRLRLTLSRRVQRRPRQTLSSSASPC